MKKRRLFATELCKRANRWSFRDSTVCGLSFSQTTSAAKAKASRTQTFFASIGLLPARSHGDHPRLARGGRCRGLVPASGEVKHVGVANQWNKKRFLYRACVGNIAHDRRHNVPANDGHDQQCGAELGITTRLA